MAIKPASNRLYVVKPEHNGDILEFGPGSNSKFVGTLLIQFNPDVNWVGSFAVLARLAGPAAQNANLPLLPVPYRRVTINNVASDYLFTTDTLVITAGTKIQVPASMDSIGLLTLCSAGSCTIVSIDLQGPSVP